MATAETISERPDWLPERLFPFDSYFCHIDGCRVHYIDEGGGPVLLFVHGNPTWSFLYRNIIRQLSEKFRCIAVDFPGFGLSRARNDYGFRPREHAEILCTFIDDLGLADIVLVGHEWGGPIGLWVAGRRPGLFSGFVLSNTFAWPIEDKWRFRAMARVAGGRMGSAIERPFNAFVNLGLPLATATHVPREVMQCYRRPFPTMESRKPIHVFARELLASHDFLFDVQRSLDKLRERPALLVWGGRDLAFRAEERGHLEKIFPAHELILLNEANHFVQEDAPTLVAEGIDEWADLALTRLG